MKWYKHDPDAFSAGTASLTLEEVGAYALLIDAFYARDGELPDDDFLLSRILRCNPRTWRKIKLALFQKQKVTVQGGNLVPNRGLSTLIEARNFSERRANAARMKAERAENVNKNSGLSTSIQPPFASHSAVSKARMQCERAEKPKENNNPPLPTTTTTTTTTTKKEEVSKQAAPRKARTRDRTSLPENFHPELAGQEEFERFCDHARANGRLCADWEAAWRNWQRSPYRNKGGGGGSRPRPGSKEYRQEENWHVMEALKNYRDPSSPDDQGGSDGADSPLFGPLSIVKSA